MKLDEVLKAIRDQFAVELSAKTGWGRTEIMSAFDRAVAWALIRFVDVEK